MNDEYLPNYIYHLRGKEHGPRVVVFGGTHGDELTGVKVVKNILNSLGFAPDAITGAKQVASVKGDLFFGIANPEAVFKGKRSTSGKRDLNRCFHESFFGNPLEMNLPDQQRAAELKDLLASADFFFDLHSVSTDKAIPFIGVTVFSKKHEEICKYIPVRYILDVNSILGQDVGIDVDKLEQTPTTCSWVNRHGGVGLCFEMGYQNNSASIPRSTQVILNVLEKIGSIDSKFAESIGVKINYDIVKTEQQEIYKLAHCERNRFKDFSYADDRFIVSWTPVKKGEVIGNYADGEKVCAPIDGVLILQAGKQTLKYNRSLFYIAKYVSVL